MKLHPRLRLLKNPLLQKLMNTAFLFDMNFISISNELASRIPELAKDSKINAAEFIRRTLEQEQDRQWMLQMKVQEMSDQVKP